MESAFASFASVFKSNASSLLTEEPIFLGQPTTVTEHVWAYLLTKLGDFGLFVFFYLSMAALYGLGGLVFYYVDKKRLFAKYKIQYDRYATDKDYMDCVKGLIFSYVCIILPLGCISFPMTKLAGLSHSLPLPPVHVGLAQMFAFLVLEDFFHYWMHRFFHTPWFYKHIHKQHHYYAAPFGLAASYAHPIETICLGICTFAPAFIIRPHYFVFYLWFIVRQMDAVYTHSGYEFPWNPFDYLPYFGGATFHDYHHKAFTCNYGSRYTYLDKLFKTYKDAPVVDETEKLKATIKPASMAEELRLKKAKKL
eukprot:TRINITY_DN1169_c0_g1_i2.p1 TRINITY_DN1169_c0_g1~~TRINITY_DN1169_c0_g1_i2.p1  ORF type:complete len:329 (-),score=51.07 TRINITY_DN1169_c0_g1_i2:186-1109(-)